MSLHRSTSRCKLSLLAARSFSPSAEIRPTSTRSAQSITVSNRRLIFLTIRDLGVPLFLLDEPARPCASKAPSCATGFPSECRYRRLSFLHVGIALAVGFFTDLPQGGIVLLFPEESRQTTAANLQRDQFTPIHLSDFVEQVVP